MLIISMLSSSKKPGVSKMIDAQHLTMYFGDFRAVNDVTFQVSAGEIFGLLGANGAGKTTTIRIMCGLLEPSSGTVNINGIDVKTAPQKIKEQIGYMSQLFTLYSDLTVEENLAFTAGLRKMPNNLFQRRKKELLELIGFDVALNSLVRDLPGGTRQHISLAASVLHDPPVVFLDEPTAGVTPAARANFWSLIKRLVKANKAIVVTTHYLDEAENCDRVALMNKGNLAAIDTPQNLKNETFPNGVYELTPYNEPSRQLIEWLQKQHHICSLQPYGLRYHVFVYDDLGWQELQPKLQQHFQITPKKPSLEDVFIEVTDKGRHEKA
ncbi:MAG: ATP-binding cassette domain-containing protein [Chlamydiota bacterium]